MTISVEGACIVSVGKKYPIKFVNPGREFGIVNFFGGDYNSILIGIDGPSDSEIAKIEKADMYMGLLVVGPVIFILFEIKAFGVFDMPLDMHLYTSHVIPLIETAESRILIDVVTIDINTSLTKTLRAITIPPSLSAHLANTAKWQSDAEYSQDEFNAALMLGQKMNAMELMSKTHMYKLGE